MLELAFLLSRAVERGFSAAWLTTAHKMVTFATAWALDPTYHAMRYYLIGVDGRPLPGNAENAYWTWWPQTETARALLHFAVVRGWDTAGVFKAEEDFIHRYQTDQALPRAVGAGDAGRAGVPQPDPSRPNKGHIWKTNYHYSAFFAEVLRLSALSRAPGRAQSASDLLAATPAR